MKKTILLMLLPYMALAQHDFKAANNAITWTHIFTQEVNAADYASYLLKELPHATPQTINGDLINGTTAFAPILLDRKGLPAAYTNEVRFNYTVALKDGRYRVQVNNIAYKGIVITLWGVTEDSDTYIDRTLIRTRDGELRKNSTTAEILQRLHDAFIEKFTYKKPEGW
jgi:hypothetical protein